MISVPAIGSRRFSSVLDCTCELLKMIRIKRVCSTRGNSISRRTDAATPALSLSHIPNFESQRLPESSKLFRTMLPENHIDELRAAVDEDGLITGESQLQTYECDGLTNFRVLPGAVVLPRSAAEVQAVVRVCARHKIPFVSRGAGTGLSGGALPAAGGVVISLARMNRILEVNIADRYVVVEPGVINAHVSQRVAPQGYFYAPDPSSQSVCTIGGNVAENSGGAHCLKYGFTVTHTLGAGSGVAQRRTCPAWLRNA